MPMLVKMCLCWLLLSCNCCCKAFKSLPPHDKFVFALASSLVPVSIPSKETKSMKGIYAVSLILFLLECLFVLLHAYLIRHYYHFEAYKDFYASVLPEKLNMCTFESIFLYMIVALLSVILVAVLLLVISNNCCHPKSTLFSNSKETNNEDGDQENEDTEEVE